MSVKEKVLKIGQIRDLYPDTMNWLENSDPIYGPGRREFASHCDDTYSNADEMSPKEKIIARNVLETMYKYMRENVYN